MDKFRPYYFVFLGALGILISILTYDISNTRGIKADIELVKSYLNLELQQVKDICSRFPDLTEADKKILAESQLFINILQGDSLIYWNGLSQKALEPIKVENKVTYVSINSDSKYRILISPDIYTTTRTLKESLNNELHLDHQLQLPTDKSLYSFKDITSLESIALIQNRYSSLIRYILFLVSFIVLMTGIRYLTSLIPHAHKAIIIHSALTLGMVMVIRLIDLSQYFQPLVLHQKIHPSSWLITDISSFIIFILSFAYWSLNTSRRSLELPGGFFSKSIKYSAASFILGIGIFYFCYLASGIIRNPKIHLDIDNILMFDKYSFIVVVLLICFQLLLFNTVATTLHDDKTMVSDQNRARAYKYLGGLLLSCVAYYIFGLSLPIWVLTTYLIVYLLMIDLFIEHRINSIIWLIWWMVIFASFMAGVIFYNSLSKDILQRKEFVNNLYHKPQEKDIIDITNLHKSVLESQLFNRLSQLPFGRLERNDLESYINQNISLDQSQDFSNLNIECYDAQRSSLFTTYSMPYSQVLAQLDRSIPISTYISYNPYCQKYFLRYQVNNELHDNAPFDLIMTISSQSALQIPQKYNYYVAKNDEIILMYDHGVNEVPIEEISTVKRDTIYNGISYVTSYINSDTKIINYKRISAIIKPVSLFSYIFSLIGIMLILIALANTKWKILSEPVDLQLQSKNSLRTKIQLVIIVLIVFSFLIIGLMTGYYFNNLLKNNQSKVFREQIVSILNSVQSNLKTAPDEESAMTILDKKLKEISEIHGKNLSLYNRSGKLVSFTNQNESMLRLPYDYKSIYAQTKDIVFQNEIRTIIPLQIKSANPYSYFTISFPERSNSYSSILDFISTILNVYVFLFLLAGAIALAIANSITRPLSVIASKLKEFKLGASNERLEYDGKDEIGQLIDEYNNLIVQVQDSADIIAKTERDMAWREMAKQVAHEIKNPLTPMKLSIQYLDKMVKVNPDRAKEITEKVANTLVNQIDALTNIANEFSNYATMPKANNEKIILNEIVEAVHDLFRKRDDMDIKLSEPIQDLLVFVDRNQLIRILNNLVKNAIQAIPENKRGLIEIALLRKGNMAIITVKDNGTGIPDEMKNKVFTPNFTTKNSGTGLGLAISANMIDSMNGRIYFDTKINIGTVFYVEIPLMRSEVIEKTANRVSLDD